MGEMVLCASGAGVLGGIAGNPAGESCCVCDMVALTCQMSFLSGAHFTEDYDGATLTPSMITDPVKPLEQRVNYRNALHGVYKLVTVDGPSALFRGLAPNTVRPSLTSPESQTHTRFERSS